VKEFKESGERGPGPSIGRTATKFTDVDNAVSVPGVTLPWNGNGIGVAVSKQEHELVVVMPHPDHRSKRVYARLTLRDAISLSRWLREWASQTGMYGFTPEEILEALDE
jgi:phosphoribosylformylglycinamidine (FGAM) synthase-like amidotransferase family enzyme